MSPTNCLTQLDFGAFDVLDYEFCYEALGRVAETLADMCNRPNASDANNENTPAAAQIDGVIEWCWAERDRMMGRLSGQRFPNPGHERRRLLLILRQQIDLGGESLVGALPEIKAA